MEERKLTHIFKRDGALVAFDREKITLAIYKAAAAVGGHDRALSEKLSEEVVEFLTRHFPEVPPSVEEIQDVVEKVLIENGHARTAKAYILYRYERARMREASSEKEKPQGNIPYKKIWQVLSWSVDHNVDTVEKLNQRIREGTFPQLVREADEAYEADLSRAAEAVLARGKEVRIVIIAGPSCSGKTTTTAKLGEKLKARGVELVALNMDDYFFDLQLHPRDEYGDYDFETPEALDLQLINEHLRDLVAGRAVQLPRFNFKAGKREKETDELRLAPDQVLLIDTLHGLYGPMTESVAPEAKFKLYIETLSQLKEASGRFARWTDTRLLRRMVRDRQHRNYDPTRTLGHWHYVRRGELKHIIPYIGTVDYIVNGALAYELPVHKKYLFELFPGFIEFYEKDPKRQDASMRARRVYRLLDSLEVVQDDSCVPGASLLREFIGGSTYEY